MPGESPVPKRAIVCVRIASETVKVPEIEPVNDGLKMTLIAQLALPARLVLQVFDC